MNNNEIMNNEVVEATEEVIENAGLSKGVKIAASIGLSVVVGVVVYKYVAKPVIANIKAQIEQKKMAAEEKTVMSGNFKYLWSSMNQQRKKRLLLKKRRNDFAENENPIVSI